MLRSLLRIGQHHPIHLSSPKLQSNPNLHHHHHHHHLRFLHQSISNSPSSSPSPSPSPSPSSSSSSFTVSYLINSCGLSPQSALSAAQKIKTNTKTTHKPYLFVNALRSYGFTHTQIGKVILKCPQLLSLDLANTVRPKLNYFLNVGYCGADFTALISSVPYILKSSLENRLKPNFELLRRVIGDNQMVSLSVCRNSRLFHCDLEANFLPNVRTLESHGVPTAHIAKFATHNPRVVMMPTDRFKTTVELIDKMGFDSSSTLFVHAVGVMLGMNTSTWERKVGLFKSLGWSQDQIFSAFVKHPFIMILSEEKLRRGMDFFEKKMDWGPSVLSDRPVLLSYSFEKRTVPRCSILSILASKGLVNRASLETGSFMKLTDESFLVRYVTKYLNEVPEISEVYKC